MYFPQSSSGNAGTYGMMAAASQVAANAGKTKLGSIICVESPNACDSADKMIAKVAQEFGFQQVYRARSSVAQPDYTAECLAARNAGVQTLLVFLDPNSVGRVASSCARQVFRPTIGIPWVVLADRMKDDPGLEGLLAN